MRLAKFTQSAMEGLPETAVWINPTHIVNIYANHAGTAIRTSGFPTRDVHGVLGTPEEVAAEINAAMKVTTPYLEIGFSFDKIADELERLVLDTELYQDGKPEETPWLSHCCAECGGEMMRSELDNEGKYTYVCKQCCDEANKEEDNADDSTHNASQQHEEDPSDPDRHEG